MKEKYLKPKRIYLKDAPNFNEKWVQDLIYDDPSILGLGDLMRIGKERTQPRAGRLDLLFKDPRSTRRYEVELQLGATDETHIIRTIEYYDIEKKRYPQYDHCAVLIAEDVTSRFLNVISLFNGTLPLIAIQMQAFHVGEHITLVFTKVLDELSLGPVDDHVEAMPTDRTYWEKAAGTKETVALADQMFEIIQSFDNSLRLKYTKYYIGLEKDGQPYNFVAFIPKKKKRMNLEIVLPQSESLDQIIDEAGLDTLDYGKKSQRYVLSLSKDEITSKADVLRELSQLAYKRRERM